jgi:hypothetical protein
LEVKEMKKLSELNNEELYIVYNRNSKLQDMVLKCRNEDIDLMVGNYLDCFPHNAIKNYELGYGAYKALKDDE